MDDILNPQYRSDSQYATKTHKDIRRHVLYHETMNLRSRNRVAAMRATQRIALQRFRAKGFEQVTIEEIAEAAGMAASTVFRHFGTKEQLVLWEEHEAELDRQLESRLAKQTPLAALRDAFIETLAGRYEEDLDFQLRRIQYIYATADLHAAAIEASFQSRSELAAALKSCLSRKNRHVADLLAGAALLALDVAMERWQAGDARESLSSHIQSAFDELTQLETIS